MKCRKKYCVILEPGRKIGPESFWIDYGNQWVEI